MKILYIHNNYGSNNSGEEYAVESLAWLLEQNGHKVAWYRRSSAELKVSRWKNVLVFFTSMYNPVAVRHVKQKLKEFQPDVVQVQNLYPFISPAIIKTIKKAGFPVVMRCPNYRLFCPNGLHLDNRGQICEKCLTPGREIHCVLKNCEKNWAKSLMYALRNFVARRFWGILKYVDVYIVQSEFQKQKFIANGIPQNKIVILSGFSSEKSETKEKTLGELVSFVSRVSTEKGIFEFLEAARRLPEISFVVAGSPNESLQQLQTNFRANVTWTGFLRGEALVNLYQNSRIIVVPSNCFEGFPNVIIHAMKYGKPVITSNLGVMASIVDHQQNGLLVEPGNAVELAKAIEYLYNQPDICKKYGENGSIKVRELYSAEQVYNRLIEIYRSVI